MTAMDSQLEDLRAKLAAADMDEYQDALDQWLAAMERRPPRTPLLGGTA
jgi:hypothetical protein